MGRTCIRGYTVLLRATGRTGVQAGEGERKGKMKVRAR